MATSNRKTSANQTNALASTGPRTEDGKARSARNAVRHGLRSSSLVVHGLEREADWRGHLGAVLQSLNPADYLETVLAADVAALTWRLARVTRYENEVAVLSQETAETDLLGNEGLQTQRTAVDAAARYVALLEAVQQGAPEDELDDWAACAFESLCDMAGVKTWGEGCFTPPAPWTEDDLEGDAVATVGRFRDCLATLAEQSDFGFDAAELLEWGLDHKRGDLRREQEALAAQEAAVARLRRSRLLPSGSELDKVGRYESHLRRSLYRGLEELRAMQTARPGPEVD